MSLPRLLAASIGTRLPELLVDILLTGLWNTFLDNELIYNKRKRKLIMSKYIPSPQKWVADQVELYEGSGGTAGLTLRDTGLPVIIVTNRGIRQAPSARPHS